MSKETQSCSMLEGTQRHEEMLVFHTGPID